MAFNPSTATPSKFDPSTAMAVKKPSYDSLFTSTEQETTAVAPSYYEKKGPGLLSQAASAVKDYSVSAYKKPTETLLGLVESLPAMPKAPEKYTVYDKKVTPQNIAPESFAVPEATNVVPDSQRFDTEFPVVDIPEEEKQARAVGRGAGLLGQAFVAPRAVPAAMAAIPKFTLQSLSSSAPYAAKVLQEKGAPGAVAEAGIGLGLDALLQGVLHLPPAAIKLIRTNLAKGRLAKEVIPSAKNLLEIVQGLPKKDLQQLDNLINESAQRISKDGEGVVAIPNAAGNKAKKGLFSNLESGTRSVLSEKTAPGTTPFNEYVTIGKNAANNPRNPTELDFAGSKGLKAYNIIDELRSMAGKEKSRVLANGENTIVDISPLKSEWYRALGEKTGATVVEGEVVPASGRAIRKPSEVSIIAQADKIINSLPDTPTIQQLDDTKSALYDLIQDHKASMVRPQTTATESAITDAWKVLDEKLRNQLGPEYAEANKKYAELLDIKSWLSKRLGEVVDPETGVTRHGASLMKSAVQSNADRGAKAQFERIRRLTGIDLFQDAKYAEISMLARGDERAFNMLKGIYESAGLAMPNPFSKAKSLVSVVKSLATKNPADEALEFYLSQQKTAVKNPKSLQELLETINPKLPPPATGAANPALLHSVTGAGVGAATGYATAPEDQKLEGTLLGAAMGALAPSALKKAGRLNQTGAVTLPGGRAEPFYSNAQNALNSIKMEKAPASQWAAMLDPAKGVGTKADENEWIGLDKFLKEKGNASVTKKELNDLIEENKVQLTEVRKGASDVILAPMEDEPHIIQIFRADDPNGDYSGMVGEIIDNANGGNFKTAQNKRFAVNVPGVPAKSFDTQQAAKRFIEENTDFGSTTKFSNYQLPGGTNYREVLLTMPERSDGRAFEQWLSDTGRNISDYKQEEIPILKKQFEKESIRDSKDNYRSSHWDEPNVLAHYRLNDRTIDGKKTLFVEEIQSDWHQEGRKKGYSKPPESFKAELSNNGVYVLKDSQGNYAAYPGREGSLTISPVELNEPKGKIVYQYSVPSGATKESNSLEEAVNYITNRINGLNSNIPNAPFKKSWHELGFKKILNEAVDGGYDKVAWTTGEQQAARYDLSKQLSEISYSRTNLKAYDHSGNEVISQTGVLPEQLPDIIGKEAAQKLMEAPKKGTLRTISGLDLKVGGEGMKGFYDKILVDYANKYGKKWGASVKSGALPSGETVHTLDITPAMKKDILTKGQALHSAIAPGVGAVTGAALPADSDEERLRNSLIGMAAALAAPSVARRVRSLNQAGAVTLPGGKEVANQNLVVLHNLTEDKLRNVKRIGGLPVPSLAVADVNRGMQNFGDISLVGSKNIVDPKLDKSAKVFNADIYSPRYPKVVSFVDYKKADAYQPLFDKVKANGLVSENYSTRAGSVFGGTLQEGNGRRDLQYDRVVRGAFAVQKNPKATREEVDGIINANQPEFENFVNKMADDVTKEEKIFKGFTNSGNRRYVPHDLENVVKTLKEELRGGEGFNYGAPSVRAQVAKKYPSIPAIQKDRNKIISSEAMEKVKKEVNDEFDNIVNEAIEKYEHKGVGFGVGNTFVNVLTDGIKRRNIAAELQEYGFGGMDMDRVYNFVNKLKDLPTEYFEAKVQRAVDISEFSGAMVPNTATKETKDFLRNKGLDVIEYDKKNAEDYAKKLKEYSISKGLNFAFPVATGLGALLSQLNQNKGE